MTITAPIDSTDSSLRQHITVLEGKLRERENAARIQKALYDVADLSFKASSLDRLFASAHAVICELMYADNFYIALEHRKNNTISFPYYIDTVDPEENEAIQELPIAELEQSLSAYLIRRDTTVFLQTEAEFNQLLEREQLALVGTKPQCLIGVPLRRASGQRGALVVQSYHTDKLYSADDKDILTFLSQHLSTALDRFEKREHLEQLVAERTQTLRHKNRELENNINAREQGKKLQEALYRIAQSAHQETEIEQLYKTVHHIIGELFYAKNFFVALVSEDGNSINFPYFSDNLDITTKSRRFGNSATEYILHKRAPELIDSAKLEQLILQGDIELSGSRPVSWMGAPIMIGDSAFGIVAAQSYDLEFLFSNRDLELLGFVADQLAEVLKRRQDSDALMLANITLEARVEQRTWELSQINGKLEDEIEERKRAEELQKTLFTIDELTQSISNITDLYQQIHKLVGRFIHADHFFVAEYDEAGGNLYFPYYADEYQALADFTVSTPENPVPHMMLENIDKTLTAYVIRTGKSLLANDEVQRELEARGEIGSVGKETVDWLGVPLWVDDRVAGVIVIQTYDTQHRFGQAELDLLQFVSSHVTAALQRKHYRESLEARVEERTVALERANTHLQQEISVRKRAEHLQTALFRIADLTSSATDMDTFYKSIHETIGQLMYARYFFIALLDSSQPDTLIFPYYIDKYINFPKPRPVGNFLTEYVINNGQTLLVTPENIASIQKSIQIKGSMPVSWLGVPLMLDGETLGALVVQTYETTNVLGKNEEEILTYVSHHVATALDRKRARAQLELRVEQRTLELSQANLSLEGQIEKRRMIEKQLEHDAFHDVLTGLPNRLLFMDRLTQIINKSGRVNNLRFAVLFLDLDRFKVVNDSLGHMAGDKLLQEVAARLNAIVRPQDTVARLGGDEFCILLDDVQGLDFAEAVAKRIGDEITKPFHLHENEVFTSTSIGVAYSALKYTLADDMLRDADAAMYQAKMLGKRQYAVFDQTMHVRAMKTLKLESELRNAIAQDEIQVYYQPIVRLSSGDIEGFEALARWQHPIQGLIPPGDFIPLAEESGLIVELDMFMCLKACQQMAAWHNTYNKPMSISVNLSSKHFSRTNLVDRIQGVVDASGINPAALKLEITESALMENVVTAQRILSDLKKIGVILAMDDFGTGYSSLSYLHRFPLDVLKVDRCFIDEVDTKTENKAIVNTIVTLAHALGMISVAEGVETDAQLAVVKHLGCDLGQGYLFSKPMNRIDAERYIKAVVNDISLNA